jgi:hypothetical protein
MSEREGSQRERGATTAVGPEGRGPDSREERALSEREGSQRERGVMRAGRSALAPADLSEERAQ